MTTNNPTPATPAPVLLYSTHANTNPPPNRQAKQTGGHDHNPRPATTPAEVRRAHDRANPKHPTRNKTRTVLYVFDTKAYRAALRQEK